MVAILAKKITISTKQRPNSFNPLKIQEIPGLSVFYYKGPVNEITEINRKDGKHAFLICMVRGKKNLLKNGVVNSPVEFASNRCIFTFQYGNTLVYKNEGTENEVELFVIKIDTGFLLEVIPANEKALSEFRNKLIKKQPVLFTGAATLLSVKMKTVLFDLLSLEDQKGLKNIHGVLVKAKLMELIAYQLEDAVLNPGGRPVTSKREEQIAHDAVEILEKAAFKHAFTLIGIANQIGTNETSLKYAFKKTFGTTLYKYFIDSRMKKAELLLKQGAKIGDVSAIVGYSNITHFSIAYKKHYGINPGKIYK